MPQGTRRIYLGADGAPLTQRKAAELAQLPGLRYHPLKGDRAGYHAVKLTGRMRLIFTLKGEALAIVCIEEVSKHYDD